MARNIVSKTINNLGLNNVGLLEMTFALTPMLSGFNLGSIPLSALMWIILIILCIVHKGRHPRSFWPLVMLFAYWFVHEFIMFFTDDVNLTGFIVQIFYFVSVFFLYPNLNIEKIKGSKYAQTVIGNAFTNIKKDLNEGIKVLFVSTPCQVDGLYHFV